MHGRDDLQCLETGSSGTRSVPLTDTHLTLLDGPSPVVRSGRVLSEEEIIAIFHL